MWDYWLKDMKILWRDRTELLVILLMPFVLIMILGFALKGVMDPGGASVEITVGLVDEDEASSGMEQLAVEMERVQLPEEVSTLAKELAPKQILYDLLEEELSDMITLEKMSADQADQAISNGEIDASFIISDNFTYHTLANMFLNKTSAGSLEIVKGEHAPFEGDIFQAIIEQFTNMLSLESAIGKATQGNLVEVDMENISAEESVTDREPMSAMEYYALGMAVMFAFFVAGTLASKAYNEIHQQVVDRLLLSGKHPVYYLLGKMFAIITMVFIQICLLFTSSAIILQAFLPFNSDIMLRMLLITFIYATSIGAIGSLLIVLTLQFKARQIGDVFSGGIVMVLSLVGGSFLPINSLPPLMQTLGSWTPNGLTLQAYMLVNQGLPLSSVIPQLSKLIIITLLIIIISIILFPKRRLQS